MSKGKVLAGGYQDSSDDENNLGADPRQRKLTPYAPPRLTTASRLGPGAFQLPGSSGPLSRVSVPQNRHVSISSSSGRPTPVPESVQSARNTPEIQIVSRSDSDPLLRGNTIEPSSITALTVPTKASLEPLSTYKPNIARSSLALERQINELTGTFEEYRQINDVQQKANNHTLACILETVTRLESISNSAVASSQPLSPLVLTPSSSSGAKPYLSNPTPTPDLVSIISKVVSEARSRVGKKKGGTEDNSCKEHACNTFYRMLGITAAREARPYFEDEYGEPDTLPAQFINPDTRYCQPYPHWKTPLTKQVAWVPTYILRFRSTIPSGRSELSSVLRDLSDEAIVILLNDGPFKSASTTWRDAKKTDAEIEAMRSNARRYQRSDRKATMRATHIKTIASLEGPAWEYLSHPGYMSQDESDSEGGYVTKRPEHRAQWETNLYDAIHVAERERARAKPGLCPRLPHRSIEAVKRPIPHLERGSGSGKVTVRIAICGISRAWRQSHSNDFGKYAHLINMKETVKPDILLFLEQHPMSNLDDDEVDKRGDNSDSGVVKLEGGWSGKEDMDVDTGASSGEADHFGVWKGVDYDGDEESGAVLEMGGDLLWYGTMGVGDELELQEPAEGLGVGNTAHIPIDPQLTAEGARDDDNKPDTLRARPGSPLAAAGMPLTCLNVDSPYGPGMPPPLPLNPDSDLVASQAAANILPAETKLKRNRTSKVGSIVVDVGDVEDGEGPPSGVTAPKRRGRPPGSKNKKPRVTV